MSDTAVQYEVLSKLTKDLKDASRTLTGREARYLVDAYYTMQGYRISYGNQVGQMAKDAEPNALLAFFGGQTETLEGQIQKALARYAEASPIGQWALGIVGIGPVITAGLLAHIDFSRAKTAGDVWRFAGLDPSQSWNKGEKRPWNASLKVLAFKAGESFVKQQGREEDYYGKIFAGRKDTEWLRNLTGEFADQARASLEKKNYAKNTNAYQWYVGNVDPEWASAQLEQGFPQTFPKSAFLPESAERFPMLSPAHIHARARRVAVKMFLSHFFEVGYYLTHNERPPAPYAMVFAGHAHYIAPPDAPWL